MNPIRRFAVCLLAAGIVPAFASAAETHAEMIAAAKMLDATFLAAYNAGDVEAISATYWKSPDVVSFPPDAMVLHGWDAIHAGYVDGFKQLPAGLKLELTESHNMVVGDAVLTWGLWKFTVPGEGGMPMVSEGRYSDVKAKRDGKWVYLIDHISVPMAPPPAE
jgi:uncharacterized protein (TIGR02246 family)